MGAAHRFENPYAEEAVIENRTAPAFVHEVAMRLMYAALSRRRPNPLELVVAFREGDSYPARVPVVVVNLVYWISRVTGVAARFRRANLSASLAQGSRG